MIYPIVVVASLILGALAARGNRTAYVSFVVLGLSFMLTRGGFPWSPKACELTLSVPLVLQSPANYAHMFLFAAFFVMTSAQFHSDDPRRFPKAALITVAMGIVIELEQGLVGSGRCSLQDLIPDVVGVSLGVAAVVTWRHARDRRMPWGAR